jgi:dihydroorotase
LRTLIWGGRVVDPASGVDAILDVLVEGGRIAQVGPRLDAPGADVLDASRFVVAPGFIDMHVHLREPGQEAK